MPRLSRDDAEAIVQFHEQALARGEPTQTSRVAPALARMKSRLEQSAHAPAHQHAPRSSCAVRVAYDPAAPNTRTP